MKQALRRQKSEDTYVCCLSEPKKLKRSYIFHCIESHCIESNRIEIRSHCIVIGVNRIASLAASYVSSVYRIIGCASRCVSHQPQLLRCTSLIYYIYIDVHVHLHIHTIHTWFSVTDEALHSCLSLNTEHGHITFCYHFL